MQAWGLTDVGTVRHQNQDTYSILQLDKQSSLLVVCDGMGGELSGDVASSMALVAFQNAVSTAWRRINAKTDFREILFSALQQANDAVFRQSYSGEQYEGMGTTLVAALVVGNKVWIVNVGDSRAYHIQKNDCTCVTVDHSYVQMMVERGMITQGEAQNHPKRNLITRAVGTSPTVHGDLFELELSKGDFLLLCSDGLTNVLNVQEIIYEVLHGGENDTCCNRLLEVAKSHGAPDNLTVVLARG